jgi:hypothetical protein
MDWQNWDRHVAAHIKSRLTPEGRLQKLAERVDPHTASHLAEIGVAFVTHTLHLDGETAHAIGDAILRSLGHAPDHAKDAHSEPKAESEQVNTEQAKAEQAKTEQAKAAEQVKDEQAKTELGKAAEQVKVEMIKADAERAAAVIEEQTAIVEQEIVDEPGKSGGEIDALNKDFERERQDREAMLDGLARNYFDKHPDLSDDKRDEAAKTFKGIKDEEMGKLRAQQETRLEELTRVQQEQREELAERLKELEGTRDERS